MRDRARIRHLHHDKGMGIRAIAREMGVARNTVRAAIDDEALTFYFRRSQLADVEAAVRAILAEYPFMPTRAIAAAIAWPYSLRLLHTLVRQLRPQYVDELAAIAAAPVSSLRASTVQVGRASATRSITTGRVIV